MFNHGKNMFITAIILMIFTLYFSAFYQTNSVSLVNSGSDTNSIGQFNFTPYPVNDPNDLLKISSTQTPYVIVVPITATPAAPVSILAPTTVPQIIYPTPTLGRAVEQVPVSSNMTPAYDCVASVQSPKFYEQFAPGDDFDFTVVFTNTGTKAWDTDVDVIQYTGIRSEIQQKYLWDLDKDMDEGTVVYPGHSIKWSIRIEAPKNGSNADHKYFATYALIDRGMPKDNEVATPVSEQIASHKFDENSGMFCPFSFYIYVP